jgi:hypothetical protein
MLAEKQENGHTFLDFALAKYLDRCGSSGKIKRRYFGSVRRVGFGYGSNLNF